MLKGFLILILWLVFGFSIDFLIAKFIYIPNTSMSIGVTFLTVGIYASLIHCVFLKINRKESSYRLFAFPSFVALLVSWELIAFFHTEYTCSISETKSLESALSFLETIEYDQRFMSKKPYKLDWCELGFEYKSPDSFRLIIVSSDGTVRLNE